MTAVDAISQVEDWLRTDVCPRILLKVPPGDGSPDSSQYEYRTGHPEVFSMYWPAGTTNARPGVEYTQPGVMVQVVDGEDEVGGLRSTYGIRLHLGAWNPGRHQQDVWTPSYPSLSLQGEKTEYGPFVRGDGDGFVPVFDDGWRDVWNFLDVVRESLRTARSIGSMQIDPTEPVRFSQYKENDAAINLYPYWFAYIDFTLVASEPGDPSLSEYL